VNGARDVRGIAIAVPVIATIRERQGTALALDYLVTQRLRA
jgi:hypothetical protein